MRRDLGLDPPERRIGLAAHDFAQGLGAPEVILSRAGKLAGAPTVTSRFVQRIAALAGERWDDVRERGERYVDLARALDHPAEVKPAMRPEPKPPLAARPQQAFGHRHRGLAARSLHDLRQIHFAPGRARPGRHAAGRARPRHRHPRRHRRLHGTVRRLPHRPIRCKELLKLGEKHFEPLADYPEARAFWWPRYERIARWFAGWDMDAARRARRAACGNPRRAELPHRRAARSRSPPSPTASSGARDGTLRHPRLQDRTGAHRKAGAHRAGAAIDAGSRHPARRRVRRSRARLGVRNRLCRR